MLAGGAGRVGEETWREERRGGGEVKVAKPQIFDRIPAKVRGFISVYKLYIRMRMRRESVERQIQWILSYVQGESANI